MKNGILLLLILLGTVLKANAHEKDASTLRQLFYQASYKQIDPEVFLDYVKNIESFKTPIVKGYKAMAYMLLSKESWNPYTKFDYFKQGRELLEEAISLDSENLELRYLRLCIQTSIPSILNYDESIEGDTKFVLKHWKLTSDKDLQKKIQVYLSDHQLLNKKAG